MKCKKCGFVSPEWQVKKIHDKLQCPACFSLYDVEIVKESKKLEEKPVKKDIKPVIKPIDKKVKIAKNKKPLKSDKKKIKKVINNDGGKIEDEHTQD